MKTLKDPMANFLPSRDVRFVILGTMASYVAREINGDVAKNGSFYYHDGRNRFWGALSLLLTGERIQFSNVEEKSEFLNSQGIALANLVKEVIVEENVETSLDDVLFDAYKSNNLIFKIAENKLKDLLEGVPVFFTCFRKTEIESLLEGYKKANSISRNDFVDRITFLHSPTRRGYQYIADQWRKSIQASHPELLQQ